jgi:hypothetical protein
VAATGAVLLIATLFLPWYGERSGFESFTVIDVWLVLFALLALALALAQATRDSPALPVALGVITTSAGVLTVLLVLYRLLDHPGTDDAAWGALAGLAEVVVITAGAWLSIADERTPGIPPGPEPELRPAPQA